MAQVLLTLMSKGSNRSTSLRSRRGGGVLAVAMLRNAVLAVEW